MGGAKKRYKDATDLTSFVSSQIEPPHVSDISVARLMDDGLVALYREMKSLLVMSSKGKLDANSARDLRDHLKLLFELKDREAAFLRGLTDEQLKAFLAQQQVKPDDSKQDSGTSGDTKPQQD